MIVSRILKYKVEKNKNERTDDVRDCCWDCRYHRDCVQYCSNSREYQTY